MKQRNRIRPHIAAAAPQTDLNELADVATSQVEHITTLEFLRRAPHHPTSDDLNRFGDRVKRAADAIPLPWLPATHPKLGIVRVYPLPLLEWVYSQFSAQFGWPPFVPELDSGSRKRQNALNQLDEAVADAPQNVQDALKVVINYLECVTGEKSQPEPTVLRPV